MLSAADARRLERIRAGQAWMLTVGLALFLLGGFYALWATERFRSTEAADEKAAFDRPIARLARLVEPEQERLRRLRPRTPLEEALVRELEVQTDLTARSLLLVLRALLGSALAMAGVLLLAGALAQRPLLDLIVKLQAGERPPAR